MTYCSTRRIGVFERCIRRKRTFYGRHLPSDTVFHNITVKSKVKRYLTDIGGFFVKVNKG
jgi:hypothetical protein